MAIQAIGVTSVSVARLHSYRGVLSTIGQWGMTYALALLFLWFGMLKYTAYEASGIAPLIMNSPIIGWTYNTLGVAGATQAIGSVEIMTGLLIAARPLSSLVSVVGGTMAVITFLITLSFMLTTPGVMQPGNESLFALSPMPGQFLLKDLVLLFASVWVLGTSIDAVWTKDWSQHDEDGRSPRVMSRTRAASPV